MKWRERESVVSRRVEIEQRLNRRRLRVRLVDSLETLQVHKRGPQQNGQGVRLQSTTDRPARGFQLVTDL